MPDTGKLVFLRTPKETENVRVETGVRENDQVSVFYDPMIAKLVVKAKDRIGAIRLLSNCLEQYQIVGVKNNVDFLKKILRHSDFIDGKVETGFISRNLDSLLAKNADNRLIAAAGMYLIHCNQSNIGDPFASIQGDRINGDSIRSVYLETSDGSTLEIKYNNNASTISIKDKSHSTLFRIAQNSTKIEKNKIAIFLTDAEEGCERREECTIVIDNDDLHIFNEKDGHFSLKILKSALKNEGKKGTSNTTNGSSIFNLI